MIVKTTLEQRGSITPEEIEMLEKVDSMPITFDEDCPELTDAELKEFQRISNERQIERNKQTVSIRLSPQTLKKAQSLGKGYTSVMSRIIETVFSDNEQIKRYL